MTPADRTGPISRSDPIADAGRSLGGSVRGRGPVAIGYWAGWPSHTSCASSPWPLRVTALTTGG